MNSMFKQKQHIKAGFWKSYSLLDLLWSRWRTAHATNSLQPVPEIRSPVTHLLLLLTPRYVSSWFSPIRNRLRDTRSRSCESRLEPRVADICRGEPVALWQTRVGHFPERPHRNQASVSNVISDGEGKAWCRAPSSRLKSLSSGRNAAAAAAAHGRSDPAPLAVCLQESEVMESQSDFDRWTMIVIKVTNGCQQWSQNSV